MDGLQSMEQALVIVAVLLLCASVGRLFDLNSVYFEGGENSYCPKIPIYRGRMGDFSQKD